MYLLAKCQHNANNKTLTMLNGTQTKLRCSIVTYLNTGIYDGATNQTINYTVYQKSSTPHA